MKNDNKDLNEIIHLGKKLLKVIYVIVLVGIVLGILFVVDKLELLPFLKGVTKVIAPLFIGFIIAWLFYPLQEKLVSKKVNKVVSAILIFLLIIGIIAGFVYLFVPVLYEQINELISYIPTAVKDITGVLTKGIDKIRLNGVDLESVKESLFKSGNDLIVDFTTAIPNGLLAFLKGIFSTIGTILISFVIGIYMLIDFDNIKKTCYKMFPKKGHNDYINLVETIGFNARKVVNGTLLVAFAVFVFDTIGFSLIGLNGSLLFGILCGVTDLIPYIGPYIGGAAAVIVGFTQSPAIGIGVLVVAIIIQALESYILQPVVMSKACELNPIIIMIGLLLFGHFFGIVGMVIATPCMSIIKEIIIFINKKRKQTKESQ